MSDRVIGQLFWACVRQRPLGAIIALLFQFPPQHRNRRARNLIDSIGSATHRGARWRPIRIGVPAVAFGVPDVFIRAEGDAIDLSGEVFRSAAMVEDNFHCVIVGLVAVHQHHRPLAIGALDRIRRDQHIACRVGDVA